MKHKLNYTIEGGSKLTTPFIYLFFHSQNQRAKAGLMAFRCQNFHKNYYVFSSWKFHVHIR